MLEVLNARSKKLEELLDSFFCELEEFLTEDKLHEAYEDAISTDGLELITIEFSMSKSLLKRFNKFLKKNYHLTFSENAKPELNINEEFAVVAFECCFDEDLNESTCKDILDYLFKPDLKKTKYKISDRDVAKNSLFFSIRVK